jgi:3-dehydroquinate synthetase
VNEMPQAVGICISALQASRSVATNCLATSSDMTELAFTLSKALHPARFAFVVVDATPGHRRVLDAFTLLHERGDLSDLCVYHLQEHLDPWRAMLEVIDQAAASALGRREPFVAIGSAHTLRTVSLAAGLFRRGTPCVRIPLTLEPIALSMDWGPCSLSISTFVPRLTDVCIDEYNPRRGLPLSVAAAYEVSWIRDEDSLLKSLVAQTAHAERILLVGDAYPGNRAEIIVNRLAATHPRVHFLSLTCVPDEKNIAVVERVLAAASDARLGPNSVLVSVGGGTIMDITGLAAALLFGGIGHVRVPTTLVGMVDAGVGLKVGVDHAGRKSLLGSYHPPKACLLLPNFLATLPADELRCGLCEAVKIAIMCDAHLFETIEAHAVELLAGDASPPTLQVIERAIARMLEQLSANPYEASLRRLPDFGHEYGHLLEEYSQHRLRHGEAVAIGMALAAHIAMAKGFLSSEDFDRITSLLIHLGLPVYDRECNPERLWSSTLDVIVPHKGGRLHLVVPMGIGIGGFVDDIEDLSHAMLVEACKTLKSLDRHNRLRLRAKEIPGVRASWS